MYSWSFAGHILQFTQNIATSFEVKKQKKTPYEWKFYPNFAYNKDFQKWTVTYQNLEKSTTKSRETQMFDSGIMDCQAMHEVS